MIDSGASLNVGRTEYHASIAKQRPDLVHHFAYLKDCEGMQPFGIGSVNGDGPSTTIDAAITYKTPYVYQGRPVVVTFALGNSIATNSILSFPFLQSIKATIMFENMTCVSAALGDSFRLEAMVPLRADTAPIIPTEAPAAYISKTPPVMRTPRTIDMLSRIPTPWNHDAESGASSALTIIAPTAPTPHARRVDNPSPATRAATIETYLLQALPNRS
jgi:hypothetical protein